MSNIEIKEEFKYRLEKALTFRNMRPKDLADKSGISESTISQYRSGYAKPKEKKLALIASALNVNPTWLMGLDVPMTFSPKIDYINDENKNLELIIEDTDSKSISKALELYEKFLKADSEVQSMVEYLLKSSQPKS